MKTSDLLIACLVTILITSISACSNQNPHDKGSMKMDAAAIKTMPKIVYTCPMHHQIRSDKPGKCPICNMTLEPMENEEASMQAHAVQMVHIPDHQQFLAGIQTDTARVTNLSGHLVLTGTAMFDPEQTTVISSWTNGWIRQLYVRNPGEQVEKGQEIYTIYSPDILSTEKDYQLAWQQKKLFSAASVNFTHTIAALRRKLIRWGLSPSQIDKLNEGAAPAGEVPVYSKSAGYLVAKLKEEGDYVREGDAVLNLAQTNTIWIQAQIYDNELALLSHPADIWVHVDAIPGSKLRGSVIYNNPVNEKNQGVHLLPIVIPNKDNSVQPGMLAYVDLHVDNGSPVVAVPKSAVVFDEGENYIWIQQANNAFERRKVVLGSDNDSLIAIKDGVRRGEKVVTRGVYLVNSEYVVKYGTGVNMAGMQMADMQMTGRKQK